MEINIFEKTLRMGVITLIGRVDAFSVAKLDEQFDALFNGGFSEFVVDLSAVEFLDSAGIARLVTLLKRARLAGGDVRLVWPKLETAQRILKLTKFDRVFQMMETAGEPIQLTVQAQ